MLQTANEHSVYIFGIKLI